MQSGAAGSERRKMQHSIVYLHMLFSLAMLYVMLQQSSPTKVQGTRAMYGTQLNVHLDVMEPVGHDALEQFVCGGVGRRADEDARLRSHIRQTANNPETHCRSAHHRLLREMPNHPPIRDCISTGSATACKVQLTRSQSRAGEVLTCGPGLAGGFPGHVRGC